MTKKLTPEQAVVVSAYTGYLIGSFTNLQKYAEEKLGRSVWTHEFGLEVFAEDLRMAAFDDFISMIPLEEEEEDR